ncbi:ABC transporter permease subunit [Pseudomonas sp. DCB_AW]|uniref:ABC transporter permease n=1 Tax=Pseudomonas sp. DCB_AW TaxID=2993596 RepID=UPI0022499DD0|nr:ABC transporter permease subunit [Pseudomonas sp. DCB_AW]MCX2684694.1 ABC transporter permease subunit [Pseudomonas sp. DCB_AW]
MAEVIVSPGSVVAPALTWLNVNHHGVFAAIAGFFDFWVSGIAGLLNSFDPAIVIAVLSVGALLIAGWRMGLLTLVGLAVCLCMGMWLATVQTIALVLLAVLLSMAFGIPLGIVISRNKRLQALARPVLDLMQTLPPWVYLVPAVILFGLGTVPALISTIVYGVAPMVRLTILAMTQVPRERIELGRAVGATRFEMLRKIELPSALPTLLVGVNQCILLSLAMVVLAGLVGAGGLGAEVTRGLTRLDFGLGLRASLAIVALAIVMDRVFRGAIPATYMPAKRT